VGLSLKKSNGDRMGYIMRNYRYMTNLSLKKFKCGIILSLYSQGENAESISGLTGTRRKYVDRYIKLYDLKDISGVDKKKNLKTDDLCSLIGWCYRL